MARTGDWTVIFGRGHDSRSVGCGMLSRSDSVSPVYQIFTDILQDLFTYLK